MNFKTICVAALAMVLVCVASSDALAVGPLRRLFQRTSHASAPASYGGGGSAYQVALASAQQRASRGIKGHLMSVERGHTTGVGWSSFNSQPNTCFGRGGANYAVARGRDGWYATKVVR